MAYRNSLLSLYPPPPTNSTPTNPPNADLTSQFEEELPATAPVFEGHLYLRTDKKQWQWRLFRFDGTSFTCLSTRKVKLPPNTHVDAPLNDQLLLQSLPSFTSTSLTSPLLATPKSKSHQHTNTSTTSPLASYYQLPKWTVDIVNISAVSVLKPSSKKKKLPAMSQKQSRCFCVRTFDGNCYIMKAHKQKDLERWLFVLTKMWKFALAMKLQLSAQQPQHQQILRQQQQHQHSYLPSSSLLSAQSQQILQSQDTLPLSRMYQRPQHTSLEENMMKTQPQMISGLTSHPTTAPASTSHHTLKPSLDYEKRYQHPILSVEKSECIDAWRQSLCELMASDPQLQVSVPPPIESIPDDDKVSIISDMTSISHRKPTPRRRASIASTSSKRSTRSSKLKPRTSAATPRLKKKRSNDVKNWIEPRKTDNHNIITPLLPTNTAPQSYVAPTEAYHVGYFQDCKTTAGSTSMTSLDLDGNDDLGDDDKNGKHRGDHRNNKNTTRADRHVKYHHSTRIKQIHVANANQISTSLSAQPQSHPSMDSLPVRRSLDDTGNNTPNHISTTLTSPLYSLAHIEARSSEQEDEEEISLADLQRSLKRASLQQQPSDTFTSSSTTHHRPSPYHTNQLHSYQHYVPFSTSAMSIAAPAIPPVPYSSNNNMTQPAIMTRPFTRSGTNSSNDCYRQPNRNWKKQTDQRRKSWVSSCEQQKMNSTRYCAEQDMTPLSF